MRLSSFKLLAIVVFVCLCTVAQAADIDTLGLMRPTARELKWLRLCPKTGIAQYAGNMGLVSAGVGWEHGTRRRFETSLLFGFLPKYSSDRCKLTITLKEDFRPWSVSLAKNTTIEPLRCGIYLNTVIGHEFWQRLPDKYPKGYYWFATKLRINAYVGSSISVWNTIEQNADVRNVSLFYELSTCELKLIQRVHNSSLHASDFLSLSVGVRVHWR